MVSGVTGNLSIVRYAGLSLSPRTTTFIYLQYVADSCSASGGLQVVAHTPVTTMVLLCLQQALQWHVSALFCVCECSQHHVYTAQAGVPPS